MSLLNGTMTPIYTVTVGAGGQAAIEFNNIPQTYTDLVIKVSSRTSANYVNGSFYLEFNDSATNRTAKRLFGAGSGTASSDTNLQLS